MQYMRDWRTQVRRKRFRRARGYDALEPHFPAALVGVLCRVTLGAVPGFDTASRRTLAYPGVLCTASREVFCISAPSGR